MVYGIGSRILRFLVNLLRNISKNCDCEAFPWNKFNVFRGERVFEEEPEIFDGFLRLAEFLVFVSVELLGCKKEQVELFGNHRKVVHQPGWVVHTCLITKAKQHRALIALSPWILVPRLWILWVKQNYFKVCLQPFKLDSYQSDTW